MTYSVEYQRANQLELLTRFLDAAGDGDAVRIVFEPKDPQFTDTIPTSWVHLADQGYLNPVHTFGNPAYQFTAFGWLRAMELSGRLTSRLTAERAQLLIKAIKARVEREGHVPVLIDSRDVAAETGLPEGWVHNALTSDLLHELYPDRGYSVASDGVNMFRAPATFGHRRGTAI